MTPSLRKQFIASVLEHQDVEQALDVLSILLILMKKFGKQLSQSPIKEFVQKNYPDAYGLYEMLGGIRFTVKNCLVIQQHLYESLGEHALVAFTTERTSLDSISSSDLVIVDG